MKKTLTKQNNVFDLTGKRGLSAILALAACALLWSTGGILIKSVQWNPLAIAGTRSLIGATVMILLSRRKAKELFHSIFSSSANHLIASISYCATMVLFVIANKLTTSANAILLQYTNPIYIILLGPLLLGEKNTWIDFATLIGVLGGMVLFFINDLNFTDVSANAGIGIVLAIISGFTYGITVIFMRRQKNSHPADSFILAHILTFIISIPFLGEIATLSVQSYTGLLILGVLQVGIPSLLYAKGITHITAISATLITMIEPICNPLWVFLLYREKPAVQSIFGGILILSCIFIRVIVKNNRKKSRTRN